MQPIPINRVEANLNEWTTALTKAFTAAGYGVTHHLTTGGGHRVALMHVRKAGHDPIYKIEFERKLIVQDGERVVICGVEVYNPKGALHVHMKGFSDKKVAKIVEYADYFIQKRIENAVRVEAKHQRTIAARKIWDDSKVVLPDWMSALANVDADEDTGTFRLLFHDHRANYGLARLTPRQIDRIVDYIQKVINEPES